MIQPKFKQSKLQPTTEKCKIYTDLGRQRFGPTLQGLQRGEIQVDETLTLRIINGHSSREKNSVINIIFIFFPFSLTENLLI